MAEKELGKESGKESGKEKEARSDLEKVRGGLEDSVEQLDRRELLQQLKLHKMILKGCFEENDMVRIEVRISCESELQMWRRNSARCRTRSISEMV